MESSLRPPVYTRMLIAHQTIMLWYVGGLSYTTQANYYLIPVELYKQQNYSMVCHLLWHFITSYIVYFSIIISVSTIVICICILPIILLALLSCLFAFYKGKLCNSIHIRTFTYTQTHTHVHTHTNTHAHTQTHTLYVVNSLLYTIIAKPFFQ